MACNIISHPSHKGVQWITKLTDVKQTQQQREQAAGEDAVREKQIRRTYFLLAQ